MEAVTGDPTEVRKVGTRGVITDFTGIIRTVKPPVMALEVVLERTAPAERVGRKGITV